MQQPAKQKTILIVDDARINRELLKKIFGGAYHILEARDGIEALEMMRGTQEIDIVLLDIFMPRKNGFEVLAEMAQEKALRGIPAVVVTSAGDADIQIRALDSGAADVIAKPYQPQIILHRVSNILNRLESERIAERSRLMEQQLRLMETDPKTGLYNKMAFCRHVSDILNENPDTTYVILRWDVDHFRAFNEIYGMVQGDAMLAGVGRYYRDQATSADGVLVAGHWHADCFVTLREKGKFDPERVMEHLDRYAVAGHPDFEFVTRIGMYEITDRTLDVAMMCDRAMLALRSVKNNFKTRYAWYDESMRRSILEEQEISSEARTALAEGQFAVYFQPQYAYAENALSGAEALVRWIHPQKGVISPGRFVPLFEQNGFICKLDQFVWERACYYLRKWIDAGLKPAPVSVNVSRQDIYNTNLCTVFQGLLEQYSLVPELLHLEITESAYMENPDQLVRVVRQLQGCGFHVEMDDFGSGYSSLNTLKDVPVDTLKLDMKFLSEEEDQQSRGGSILSSIVHMAHGINLPVIAEGVETRRQAEYLKSVGCQYMQGYLFAQPMPAEEYEALLQHSERAAPDERFTPEIGGAVDFLSATTQSTLLFNSFVGGAAILEYDNGKTALLRVNDTFLEILGMGYEVYARGSQQFVDCIAPEHRKVFLQMLTDAIREGAEAECELRTLPQPPEEKSVWLHVRARYLTQKASGRLLYLAIDDINVRMNLLRHNTELSQRLSAIVRSLPGAVYNFELTTHRLRTVYFNDRAAEMFGFTREEYSRRFMETPFEAVHPDDRAALMQMAQRAYEGSNENFTVRLRHICRNGSWHWGQLTGSVSRRSGRTAFASAILLDVEKEVEGERLSTVQAQELEHQRAFLQELYSTIPCGIMRFTAKEKELYLGSLNDAAWKIFGFASKAQYMESLRDAGRLKDVHPDDRELVEENIRAVLRQGCRRDFNHRILRQDGSVRWVHTLLQKVQPQTEATVLQFVFTDITDQIRKDLDRYSNALLGMYDETYELDAELDLCTLRASRQPKTNEPGKVYVFSHELEKACAELVAPEKGEELRRFLDFSQPNGENRFPCTREFCWHGQGEAEHWISLTVLYAGGSQYLLCSRDITAEKHAAALERENSMLQAAASERKAEAERNRIFMDAMGVLVFEYDPASDVMKFSSRAEEETTAPNKTIEHYLRDLMSYPVIAAADRAPLREMIQKAILQPCRQSIEYTSSRFGSFARCHSDFISVADAEGKIYRIVGVISPIQDKIEQRQIAQELMRLTGTRYEGEQYQAQVAEQMLQIFNEAEDIGAAVNTVLGVIGRKMEVSRVYVTEQHSDGIHCSNTFEWCNTGIRPQIDRLQNFTYPPAMRPYGKQFNADGLLLCPDVRKSELTMLDVLRPQGVRSMIHCAIMADGVFRGYVGFDDCVRPHEWTETQIHTLVLLTRLITAYVYSGAAGGVHDFKAQQQAMEESRAYIFVLDRDSMEVLYSNRAARAEYGVSLPHEPCYLAFAGQDHPCEACPVREVKNNLLVPVQIERAGKRYIMQAAYCRWAGRPAVLLTGTDAASFAQQPELTRKTRYRYQRQQIVHSLYNIYDEILELDYLKNAFRVLNTKISRNTESGRATALDATIQTWAKQHVHAEDREAFCTFMQLDNIRASCASGGAPMLEYRILLSSGKEKWCMATILQMDANRYLCCNLDITARKRAQALSTENAALAAELAQLQRYRILVDHTGSAVMDWDLAKGTFYASEGLAQYTLALTPQQELLQNKGLAEAVYPEDQPLLDGLFAEIRGGKLHAVCELRLKMCAGGYRWTRVQAETVRNAQGGLLRAVACFTDIHDQVYAQQKLQNIGTRAQELLRSLPAGIVIYGKKGERPLYVNERACDIFGFTHAEYERCEASDPACRIPDVRAFAPADEHAYAPGEHPIQRLHLQKKDGSWLWVSAICYNIQRADGQSVSYSVLLDVSARVLADQAGLDQQQETAALIQSIPGGILKYSADDDQQFSFISKNMLNMLGYTREEFLQKFHNRFPDMVYEGDRARVCAEIDNQIKEGSFDTCEYRIETRDGALKWVYDAGHLVVDEDGNRWYVVVIVDIEKRKQLEQALEKEKQRANALIANAPGGVIEYDVTSGSPVVMYLSSAIARMLGYETQELLRLRRKDTFGILHPEDVPVVQQTIQTALAQKEAFSCQYRIRCKNGHYRWVSITANPAPQADGRCLYYGTYSDISQLREMEDKLLAFALLPQNEKQISLFDLLPCGITLLDGKGKMYFTNSAGRGMRTADPEAAPEDFRLSPWELEKLEAPRRAAIRTGRPQPYEYALSCDQGQAVWISGVMYRSVNAQGEESVMAVYNDVSRLKTERRQMEELIENLPGGVLLYRIENGRPTHELSSAGTACLLGYASDQEMNNESRSVLAKHFYEKDKAAYLRLFFEAIAGERPFEGEFRVLLHEGEIRWINFNATPMRQQDGTLYFCGICTDVTAKKAAEEQEQQRQKMELMRFREEIQYLESAQSENLLGKLRYNHTRHTLESCTICGETSTGLSGTDARKQIILPGNSPKDQAAVDSLLSAKRILEEFAEGKNEASLVYQGRDSHGRVLWVKVTVKTFRDPKNGDIKSFVYSNDIDEEHTAEAVIDRVAELEFELLGVLRLDSGLLHCYRHSELEEEIHCGVETLYRPAMEAFVERYLPQENRSEARKVFSIENILHRLETDKYCEYTFSVERGGATYRKHWEFTYLDEAKTAIIYARVDISEIFAQQDRQQKQLRKALLQAQEAVQAKTEFLARMSHEMRTPMNAIIGLAGLAADNMSETGYIRSTMAQITDAGRLLLRQINDVLEVSHLQNAEIHLEEKPYQLEELYDQMDLLIRPLCEKKQLHFMIVPMEKLPGAQKLMADGVRLQQIFFNLLANAVKFTPEGGKVIFRVENAGQSNNRLLLRAQVADNGVGMTTEFQAHIFEPFVRSEYPQQAATGNGAGLGLTTVKRLVDLMGGTIRVRSAPGKGTCFTIELPLAICPAGAAPVRPAEIVVSALRGRRILVVEDNHLNTVIVKALLEKQGARVDCAENGAVALQRFEASAIGYYDAVLMDIRMPVMDGLAATRALRALPREDVATLPIVSVSANAYAEDVEKSLAAGMDAHLPKPIDPAKLYETLSALILQKRP